MNDAWKQVGILLVLLVLFVVGIFGIIGLRRNTAKAPSLEVGMEDVTYTDKDKVPITGSTEKNAEVKANGQVVPTADDGTFSFDQPLNEGENKVKIEATSNGKTTTVEKNIVRQAPEKDVAGAQDQLGENTTENGNLNNSGPVENVLGIFGLTAIVLSIYHYKKTKKVDLDYKLFT